MADPINWTSRVGDALPAGSGRVYFFKKAYDDYTTKSPSSTSDPISSLEKELSITHTVNIEEFMKTNTPLSLDGRYCDPIKDRDISSLVEDLRVAGVQYKKGLPYVDLLLILGKYDEAIRFASTHNKTYNVTDLLESAQVEDRPSKFKSAALCMLMNSDGNNSEALRLTTLFYRLAASRGTEFEFIIAELWSLEFRWDAYCLAQLMYPDSSVTAHLRQEILKFVKPATGTKKPSGFEELVNRMKHDVAVCGYDDTLLSTEDPIQLYRLLKIDIARNEKLDDDLTKLNIRAKNAVGLRHIILATFIRLGAEEAYSISEDAYKYIGDVSALSDYFIGNERLIFKPSIEMLGDMLQAIQAVFIPNKPYIHSDLDQGLLHTVRSCWSGRIASIWSDRARRDAVANLCSGLRSNLENIQQHIGKEALKMNVLKLAILLSRLALSNELTIVEVATKEIGLVIQRCGGFSSENANSLIQRFLYAPSNAPKPVAVVSDQGKVNEAQFTEVETKWESSESVGYTKVFANGDGQQLSQGEKTHSPQAVADENVLAKAQTLLSSDSGTDTSSAGEKLVKSFQEKVDVSSATSAITVSTTNDRLDDMLSKSVTTNGAMPRSTAMPTPSSPKSTIVQTATDSKPTPVSTASSKTPSYTTVIFKSGGFEELEKAESSFGTYDRSSIPPSHYSSGPRHNGNGRGAPRGGGGRGGRF